MEGRATERWRRPALCDSPRGSGRAAETTAGAGPGSAAQSQPHEGALGGARVPGWAPEVYQSSDSETGGRREAFGG
eukprot:8608297-Alexandrium_andersonii.AAC.1